MIEILQGGTRTTLQDAGRPGHRHLGIPGSGAADRLSFGLANYMAGNRWDAPALECELGGLHLRFKKPCIMALAGAEMWAQINGQNILNFAAHKVEAGDILTMSFARDGCRAYIAIAGGLAGDEFLGSVSTYLPAQLGGIEGRPLKAGDIIGGLGLESLGPQKIPPGYAPGLSSHVVLRARPAPEYEELEAPSLRYLFTSPFYVTGATDRMGARLRGDLIKRKTQIPMISSPLLPGTLQLPPDGQPILALVDGHCTGGYARILQVTQADQWIMGQIAPGSAVSFRRCFQDESPKILKSRNAFYGGLMPGFRF